MPAAPTANFSFDRDVVPYASRHFDRLGADPNLSHQDKMRLQGTLLGGIEGIQAQRLKLQEERDMGRQRRLNYESSAFDLEEARAKRVRLEQQEQRRAGITATAKSILDSPDDPETKRQRLARTALDFADDQDALKTFDIASKALPEPKSGGLTPHQVADYTARLAETVHPDDLPAVLSNPTVLGQYLHEAKTGEDQRKEAKKLAEDKSDQAKATKLELAKMPLKFRKPEIEGEEPVWLEDSSTAVATKVVETLGTPEEKARFAKLKTASSDRERAMMVELIQLRHRFDHERPEAGRKSASSVTGL